MAPSARAGASRTPASTPTSIAPSIHDRRRSSAGGTPSGRRRSARIVGLLGGVGSGKSAVAAELAKRGARVVDADAIVHRLYASAALVDRLVRRFGAGIRDANGRLDRAVLAGIVFRSAPRLAALERIVHPAVLREIRSEIRGARKRRGRRGAVLVLDVPLLLETGLDRHCDVLVFVSAPERVRLARLARGRGLSRAEAARRARFQKPLAEKRRRADVVVDNGGTRAAVARQVRRLWESWGLD